MLTDIEIAQQAHMLPIAEVAAGIGIEADDLEFYGKYKAKLSDELARKVAGNPDGRLILVTAINPTPAGEGKTNYNHRNRARRGTQGLYQDIQSTPMYEFGYGLSYTTFEYGPLTVSSDSVAPDGSITAEITVTNTGNVDGKETVHWFICDPYSRLTRPVKELRSFGKQLIKAGESVTFRFEIDPLRDLGFVDGDGNRFVEPGEYRIMVKDRTAVINVTD